MKTTFRKAAGALAVAAGLGIAGAAQGAVFTFNTSDSQFLSGSDNQGWWSATQSNSDGNDNYFTGTNGGNVLRSFFSFDLAALSGNVVSAVLEVRRFDYNSGNATETLGLFDVSTAAATLNSNVGTSAAIFADLGSGTSYGTFTVSSVGNNADLLSFSLNAAGLADIMAGAGGFFSIGGDLLTNDGNDSIFSSSTGSGTIQRLVVTTSDVPEPGSLALLGLGLVGGLGFARKRG